MNGVRAKAGRIVMALGALGLCTFATTAQEATVQLARGASSPSLAALETSLAAAGLGFGETLVAGDAEAQRAGLLDLALASAPPMVLVMPFDRTSRDLAQVGALADLRPALALEDVSALIDPACVVEGRLACIPIGSGSDCGPAGPIAVVFPASDDQRVVALQWQTALTLFDAEIAGALGTGGFCTQPAREG
ncbi:hypothetical protein SAMN02983003_0742 [Devosia enhydra]|uniref:Uncharacterized protein n=1 Tax=Devosia enhydra TaxID=665118 RepID=A0A1K2HVM0_9HYPH|nr:hypothetical protein [Devosia enhydra]SFZ81866.1 hypothetical protein SAMN02983003_0742 [Devosia enhydra]